MAVWDDVLGDHDRAVFQKAGYGKKKGFGKKPVLFIIDVTYEFVGFKPEPVLQSIDTLRTSCGEKGWQAVPHIKRLLDIARSRNIARVYSVVKRIQKGGITDAFMTKKSFVPDIKSDLYNRATKIVEEIKPLEDEPVISKIAPSIFWGTELLYYLNRWGIDTCIITGTTTSGCIRASAVDAFSYGLNAVVVEEAVFDRADISHKVNLLDINSKYGDVVSVKEAEDYLKSVPGL